MLRSGFRTLQSRVGEATGTEKLHVFRTSFGPQEVNGVNAR
jgi:hypothetical protein